MPSHNFSSLSSPLLQRPLRESRHYFKPTHLKFKHLGKISLICVGILMMYTTKTVGDMGSSTPLSAGKSGDTPPPLLLMADEMWFDENTNEAHALGNVQLYQPQSSRNKSALEKSLEPLTQEPLTQELLTRESSAQESPSTKPGSVSQALGPGSFYGLQTGGNVLLAHEVSYNTTTDVLSAFGGTPTPSNNTPIFACEVPPTSGGAMRQLLGKVLIYDNKDTVLFADNFTGSSTLGEATIVHPLLLTADNRRMASVVGYKDGPISRLERTVYTPCNSCTETNPTPLWQIKAEEVIHDDEEHDIIFKDAWLEMWGTPVFFLPRLSQPDPTVERRSGLLGVQFLSSKSLGLSVTPSYYYVISPHTDFTFSPILSTKERPVLGGAFRHRFNRGILNFDGSLTRSTIASSAGGGLKPHTNTRWHVDTSVATDLSDTWRLRSRIYRQSDPTFLMRFKFLQSNQLLPDTLTSDIVAEGFYGQNYAAAKAYAFQSTNPAINQKLLPIVAPHVTYNFVTAPDADWGYNFYGKMGFMNLTTQNGPSIQRVSTLGGWQLPLVSSYGDLITLKTQAHMDGYITERLRQSNDPQTGQERRNTYTAARLFPQVGLEWRRPLINDTIDVPVVVSPIVSIIGAPVIKPTFKIPNEDSQGGIELDEASLFLMDRFAGVDRLDSGSRFNYGLLTEFYPQAWQSARFFLGQSYAFDKNTAIPSSSGAGKGQSDIVGMMELSPSDVFMVRYRFLLDSKKKQARTSQVTTSMGYPILRLTGSYLFAAKNSINTAFAGKEQVSTTLSSQFTNFWRGEYGITRDLGKNGGNLEQGVGIVYEDECFKFASRLSKSYFHNQELQPETAVYFTFGFKTLGEYSTGTSITKILGAQNDPKTLTNTPANVPNTQP